MNIAPATPAPAARPRLDLFLIAILVGLAALLVVAGISVLFRQPAPQLPANTPGGAVQRFYSAMQTEDYRSAYLLLSDSMSNKPTETEFTNSNIRWRSYDSNMDSNMENERVRIDSERLYGSTAYVTVKVTHYNNNPDPFGDSYSWIETESFTLQQEGDTWLITELPYRYRSYWGVLNS